jgi:hypothetical protein
MSSYDERNTAQIAVDEILNKYKTRAREAKFTAIRYKPDEELEKQLNLLVSDLTDLKSKIDKVSKKVINNGKKI